jgi:rare lipoprotein A (peptidoglycan hydrolase)
MTAAHRTLPFGTLVDVCHNGCVTVRINDRGPFVRGRQIDLSPAAARAIELKHTGHVTISRHDQSPTEDCNKGGCAVETPTLPKPDRVRWGFWNARYQRNHAEDARSNLHDVAASVEAHD